MLYFSIMKEQIMLKYIKVTMIKRRIILPYLSSKVIEEAKQVDLLTYLRLFEPNELVRLSTNTYTTKTHDSLKISNGKWMWWSRGIGGYNALDYLVKVKEMGFIQAVETITGLAAVYDKPLVKTEPEKPRKLLLPDKSYSSEKVVGYLFSRGIDLEIINSCIENGFIFESLPYHNAVFVGYDKNENPRYACYRATNNSRIMGDATGSDKHFSFRLQGDSEQTVHLFECAIDVLSYATLLKMECKDWRASTLLSLAGVYAPKQNIADIKVPVALEHYLKEYPQTKKIYLHFDNDITGRKATKAIQYKLGDCYVVIDNPVPIGKDVNDFLCSKLGINRKIERNYTR